MSSSPKAFISHATEDKVRFVNAFAVELRKAGIDAWVDQWEILAGDSLVQKIFEEGIRNAAVVIVVLSKVSVTKKWVREELDAAVVARINRAARLIPIVIEDCEVPSALQATKWIRFQGNLSTVVDEVVRAVFGNSAKPSVGNLPGFVASSFPSLPGLDRIDSEVLYGVGEAYFDRGHRYVDKSAVIKKLQPQGIRESQIDESLEMLSNHGFLFGTHAIGHKFFTIELSLLGAERVLAHRFPDLNSHIQTVIRSLVNESLFVSTQIATRHSMELVLVDFILDSLEARGSIKMSKSINGPRQVFDVSVPLKRSLR